MICLVRHAQTDFNKEGKMQGRSNNGDLNDKGLRQVKELREKIKSIDFDICFTSPLLRTMETAFGLVGDRTLIVRDERLIERDLGDFEGKERNLYNSNKYWDYKLNCKDCGVESVKELFSRCSDFLDYINENYFGKNVLIVSHAAVIRAFHFLLSDVDLDCCDLTFSIENCFFEKFD